MCHWTVLSPFLEHRLQEVVSMCPFNSDFKEDIDKNTMNKQCVKLQESIAVIKITWDRMC